MSQDTLLERRSFALFSVSPRMLASVRTRGREVFFLEKARATVGERERERNKESKRETKPYCHDQDQAEKKDISCEVEDVDAAASAPFSFLSLRRLTFHTLARVLGALNKLLP